jgi:hypothetical protein
MGHYRPCTAPRLPFLSDFVIFFALAWRDGHRCEEAIGNAAGENIQNSI